MLKMILFSKNANLIEICRIGHCPHNVARRVAAVLADRAFSRQPKIGKFNRQFNENEQ